MIRRFSRYHKLRAEAMQERRRIAAEAVGDTGRLLGRCELCGHAHGMPEYRSVCEACGRERCYGGCEHGREA